MYFVQIAIYYNCNMNIGDKVGKLTLIKEVEKLRLPCGQFNRAFLCKCECGNDKIVRLLHLQNKRTNSCGCLPRGKKRNGTDVLRKVWRQMKRRCESNEYVYRHYFNENIFVCDEWQNYENFKEWSLNNGYKKGLHIDRIDNLKEYSPNNCRWVTVIENMNNKRDTFFVYYKGERKALALLLRELNLFDKYHTIFRRLKRGWPIEKSIEKDNV